MNEVNVTVNGAGTESHLIVFCPKDCFFVQNQV